MWTDAESSRWERNLKAMVRSAGADDPEAFAELMRLSDWLAKHGLAEAYAGLRDHGYSVRDIARPLPVSHQALHARYANIAYDAAE